MQEVKNTENKIKKVDRRVIKTKKSICNALADLLTEKHLDSITITDIANKADVNRKTIYNYYKGINDIIYEIESNILKYFEDIIKDLNVEEGLHDSRLFFKRLTNAIARDEPFYEKLLSMNINSQILIKLIDKLKEKVTEEFLKFKISDYYKARLTSSFVVSGMLCTYKDWLRDNRPITVEELALDISKILFIGLNSLYDK